MKKLRYRLFLYTNGRGCKRWTAKLRQPGLLPIWTQVTSSWPTKSSWYTRDEAIKACEDDAERIREREKSEYHLEITEDIKL